MRRRISTSCQNCCLRCSTGGLGYIGSHTALQLLAAGAEVLLADNFANSAPAVEDRLRSVSRASQQQLRVLRLDLRDKDKVMRLFKEEKIDAVIHYAGEKAPRTLLLSSAPSSPAAAAPAPAAAAAAALKSVGESVQMPLMYYENNVGGTCNLLQAMEASGVKTLVFSSSATVYAAKPKMQINEKDPLGPSNPYGHSKAFIEQILKDVHAADSSWRVSILRYFNPVGAHPSGLLGEAPQQPNNLLPVLQQVAAGQQQLLQVFGSDWDTPDGTGVRDYLHVDDLAAGHLAALRKLLEAPGGLLMIHNLGTGVGHSVLELKSLFEEASGRKIPFKVVGRRPGDLAYVVADPSLAEKELGWRAERSIRWVFLDKRN
ncbi:UDP-N-acetylglucosamine 4-epimerase (Fragment) [Eimeria tenella]|uniref:UDP-glucose 4-epimerase n=1 Tax=Eimeria tenella TaxID=5802 RepID=U6KSG2_EIMTE